jgi:hypothetical protein
MFAHSGNLRGEIDSGFAITRSFSAIVIPMDESNTYQCPACGLHYIDKNKAEECEEFCRANNACSLDITRFSVEAGH